MVTVKFRNFSTLEEFDFMKISKLFIMSKNVLDFRLCFHHDLILVIYKPKGFFYSDIAYYTW